MNCQFCGKELKLFEMCDCAEFKEEARRRTKARREHTAQFEPAWKRAQRRANWESSGSLSSEWVSN
jgi:hypothetical protein